MNASYQNYIGAPGPDSSALSIGEAECPAEFYHCTFAARGADWGMKMSRPFGAVFRRCIFDGGVKRALDIVRGGDVLFQNCLFLPGPDRRHIDAKWSLSRCCDVGLKAGVRDVTFENCQLNDLLLGDYSIYDQINRPKTRRIKLIRCYAPEGRPVIVRGRHADPVITENTEVDEFIWPTWLTRAYWEYNRKFGDRRVITPDQFVLDPRELV